MIPEDPFIEYEFFDPETGKTTATSFAHLSVIDQQIARGEPVRFIAPEPEQLDLFTDGGNRDAE